VSPLGTQLPWVEVVAFAEDDDDGREGLAARDEEARDEEVVVGVDVLVVVVEVGDAEATPEPVAAAALPASQPVIASMPAALAPPTICLACCAGCGRRRRGDRAGLGGLVGSMAPASFRQMRVR
jgi:hypothetical protein